VDKSLILKRIKEYFDIGTDAEFARRLGISSQNLSNWYNRGTYDTYLILHKFTNVNEQWLLTGEGEMIKHAESPVNAETLTIPREVWETLHNQLKEKDEQIKNLISVLSKDRAGA
jgi:phage repressor protein C with HTH and peptisase S24 domain